jgi:hypothetical protein
MESDGPEDVAEIYRELAEEDRRLAAIKFTTVIETWPIDEEADQCPLPS